MPRVVGGAVFNNNQGVGINYFPNATNASLTTSDHGGNGAPLNISLGPLGNTAATLTVQLGNSALGHTGPSGVPAGALFNESTAAPVNINERITIPSSISGTYAHMLSLMWNESERLRTFDNGNWPSTATVRPIDLAKGGFIYVGRDDRVCCPFCELDLMGWRHGEIPVQEHAIRRPSCPFVQALGVWSIPVKEPESQNRTMCGNTTELENDTAGDIQGPRHEEYYTANARVRSFANWQGPQIQLAEILASAGYFYNGESDTVKCFFCGERRRNLDSLEDPWTEHARVSPRCGFVRQCKVDTCIPKNEGRHPFISAAQAWEINARLNTPENQSTGLLVDNRKLTNTAGRSPGSVLWNEETALKMVVIPQEEPGSHSQKLTEASRSQNASMTHSAERNSLEQENKRLKETRTCKICLDREVGVVFLPCSHLVACVKCVPELTHCPICRKAITGTVRSILS